MPWRCNHLLLELPVQRATFLLGWNSAFILPPCLMPGIQESLNQCGAELKLLKEAAGHQENPTTFLTLLPHPPLPVPLFNPASAPISCRHSSSSLSSSSWCLQATQAAEASCWGPAPASLAQDRRPAAAEAGPMKGKPVVHLHLPHVPPEERLGLSHLFLSVALKLFGRHFEIAWETAIIQLKRLTLWTGGILTGRQWTHGGCCWFRL
ncbi:uncharacterized protein LOC129393411 [Pan paniscus]|uniref:uncharacterized protein LOC129393411 n=1 Tax=Pan paniscus TaxID=9597 RepID=UPI0024364567|nr:uncharacterized protein LOC129393411 [Pan paniscus]